MPSPDQQMERRYEQTGRALKHRFGSMLVSGRRLLQRRVALEERVEGFPKAGGPNGARIQGFSPPADEE